MGQITSGIGIISGLNTSAIISALLTFDQAPVKVLQGRVTNDNSQVTAFTSLSTQLGSLKTISDTLGKTNTFQASTATSSDPNVLTATTTPGAALRWRRATLESSCDGPPPPGRNGVVARSFSVPKRY